MLDHHERDLAPDTWAPARRTAKRLLEPLDRFLHVEAASGTVLLVAALVALAWANSSWGSAYDRLWNLPITFGLGSLTFSRPIHFWINDGLMTIFFFVVGLEIRREIHGGELSDLKRATLPLVAAIGGMVVPALVFWTVNLGSSMQRGWAVPMATDIAFAVGVLALLGRRAPPALRVLLLALAIIDDIGAIVVIALVFSAGVSLTGLAVACGGVGIVVVFQKLGVRRAWFYVVPGIVVWAGLLRAGIHPTMAGVVMGLLTPAKPWFGEEGFLSATQDAMAEIEKRSSRIEHRPEDLVGPLRSIGLARREALVPVVRIEAALHSWVAFGVMPLFALANAGVQVAGLELGDRSTQLASVGITLGLLFGKPLGIMTASFIAVRLRLSGLPHGIGWPAILVLGCVGGIGFTMAIFMAELAFGGTPTVGAAKLAVLIGSGASGIIGLLLGRWSLRTTSDPRAARTAAEAERSAEQ